MLQSCRLLRRRCRCVRGLSKTGSERRSRRPANGSITDRTGRTDGQAERAARQVHLNPRCQLEALNAQCSLCVSLSVSLCQRHAAITLFASIIHGTVRTDVARRTAIICCSTVIRPTRCPALPCTAAPEIKSRKQRKPLDVSQVITAEIALKMELWAIECFNLSESRVVSL